MISQGENASVADAMAHRTTPQLLEVLRGRHDYVPAAISAALAELKRREVSGFDVSNALDDGTTGAWVQTQLESLPLPLAWRVFWLIFPILAITPLGTMHFHRWADHGYRRRSIQFLEAATIGFTGYLIVLMVLLNWF
jgi:hypothetical protein